MPSSSDRLRFNPPPNWPPLPTGWTPPPGWRPEPAWGPAPYGWPLWVSPTVPVDPPAHRRRHEAVLAAVLVMLVSGLVMGLSATRAPAGAGARPVAERAVPAQEPVRPTAAARARPAGGTAAKARPPAARRTTGKRTAGVPRPVRDGSLEFVVRRVGRQDTIGDGLLATRAQGRFVVIWIDLRNIGRSTRTFVGAAQRLYDAQGRGFTPTTALFRLPGAGKAVVNRIGAGHRVVGVPLVFDVPAGARLDRLELHDFFLSGGVDVPLGRR